MRSGRRKRRGLEQALLPLGSPPRWRDHPITPPLSPALAESALLLGAATGAMGAQLFAIARHDRRTLRIPDSLNLVLLASGLVVCWALNLDLAARLIGTALGFIALWGLGEVYFRARGRDGLGLGDAKLLGAGGAWIGWTGLPFAALFAASLGLAYVALRRVRGRPIGAGDAFAFGPFLAAGLFTVWLVQRFLAGALS
jgi:leader peptidase (prepilin peptidase) / N-methyltransferase